MSRQPLIKKTEFSSCGADMIVTLTNNTCVETACVIHEHVVYKGALLMALLKLPESGTCPQETGLHVSPISVALPGSSGSVQTNGIGAMLLDDDELDDELELELLEECEDEEEELLEEETDEELLEEEDEDELCSDDDEDDDDDEEEELLDECEEELLDECEEELLEEETDEEEDELWLDDDDEDDDEDDDHVMYSV